MKLLQKLKLTKSDHHLHTCTYIHYMYMGFFMFVHTHTHTHTIHVFVTQTHTCMSSWLLFSSCKVLYYYYTANCFLHLSSTFLLSYSFLSLSLSLPPLPSSIFPFLPPSLLPCRLLFKSLLQSVVYWRSYWLPMVMWSLRGWSWPESECQVRLSLVAACTCMYMYMYTVHVL